jgi:hypothetical protein
MGPALGGTRMFNYWMGSIKWFFASF